MCLKKLIEIANSFAKNSEDTEEITFQKKLILIVSLACCGCGLFWAAMYYFFLGTGLTMCLPLLFVLIVGLSIPLAHILKNHLILEYSPGMEE